MKSKLKVLSLLGLSLMLGLGAVSCGGGNVPTTPAPTTQTVINVESVLLTASQDFVKVNQTLSLTTTITPSNATNKAVTYSLSNDNATISDDGVITGVKVGAVDVTVTTVDGGKTHTLTINVIEDNPYGYLNIEDYTKALIETPYSIPGLSGQGDYGLSSETEVGVKQEEIKELYSVDKDISYAHTINVEDITLEQVQQYFHDATELNDYYRIQTAFNLAELYDDDENIGQNYVKISFPGREMNVDGTLTSGTQVFCLDYLNNITLEGNGTIINVSTVDMKWKGYISASNSKNILLHNLTFKLQNPSSLTGQIPYQLSM